MTSNISQAKDVSPELHQLDANLECQNDMTDSYFRTPSPTSTPALSSASDTDTESEAPSTSNPPSPNEPELMGTFASSTNSEGRRERGTINPYFPLLPSHAVAPNTRPGQTPPFSMIYPEYAQGENLRTPSSDDSEVTLSNLVNKVKLQAIPSPSLAPPSPFSLYPPSKNPSPIEERFARGQTQSGVMTKRAFAAARSRSALSLSSIPIPPSLHMEAEEQLGPSFNVRSYSYTGIFQHAQALGQHDTPYTFSSLHLDTALHLRNSPFILSFLILPVSVSAILFSLSLLPYPFEFPRLTTAQTSCPPFPLHRVPRMIGCCTSHMPPPFRTRPHSSHCIA
ncbi:hypothetical protein QCA50_008937 [Cerrena zonata]|uniref:Uncharacterized protein n=1 Tax=Cerrena zonata TaxID=2478898 RepID=A0AAW0GDL8_9APHY